MTSKMRQFASIVLASWLLSWSIVVLQPCCDSILQSPQSHHHSNDNMHHADHAGDHHAAADAKYHDSTQDCRIAIQNLDGLAVPVIDVYKVNNQLQTDISTDSNLFTTIAFSKDSLAAPIFNYTHSPPGNNQLYFSTLRIRI